MARASFSGSYSSKLISSPRSWTRPSRNALSAALAVLSRYTSPGAPDCDLCTKALTFSNMRRCDDDMLNFDLTLAVAFARCFPLPCFPLYHEASANSCSN